jgi:tyrosyl-tRNA synthetase
MTESEIAPLEASAASSPEERHAQSALAKFVTEAVHGNSGLEQAVRASKVFFGGEMTNIGADQLLEIFSDVPSVEASKDVFAGEGMPLVDLLVTAGAAKSKGEARRAIEGGGVYLNNVRSADVAQKVTLQDSIEGKFIALRKGGKNYFLIKII